jgi:hypothetical protein
MHPVVNAADFMAHVPRLPVQVALPVPRLVPHVSLAVADVAQLVAEARLGPGPGGQGHVQGAERDAQ